MQEEVWKDVLEWEGRYKVSNLGNIFSVFHNRKMKLQVNKGGYYFFLAKNGKYTKYLKY